MADFQGWPKIPRLSREVVLTEKIDGSNAAIYISTVNQESMDLADGKPTYTGQQPVSIVSRDGVTYAIWAQSRTRFITPQSDNFGFAQWVYINAEELAQLGEGRHFGEWWGSGIQRGYGQPKGRKRFSLFNTGLWHSPDQTPREGEKTQPAPSCCDVVPILYRGLFDTDEIDQTIEYLKREGSQAAPGFMQPEGIIVYHTAGGHYYKKLLKNDDISKGDNRG